MSAQTSYGYATSRGLPGEIYDMFHYPVDSRFNEEPNGVLRFGVGVVPGSLPGSNVKLPTGDSTAADFEGVVVNAVGQQQDLEGKLAVLNNQNVGVIRRGRIWVRLAEGAEPEYGDALHMIVEGDEAGCFDTEGGVEIPGRFLGDDNNGIAPVELYGIPGSDEEAESSSSNGGTSSGGSSGGSSGSGSGTEESGGTSGGTGSGSGTVDDEI